MAKTAEQAKKFIDSLNERKRALRPTMLRNIGRIYVFSLYWHPFNVNLGHMGSFLIPAFNKNDPRQARRGYSDPLPLPEIFAEEYDMMSGKMGLQLWNMMPDEDDPDQPGVINDVLGIGSAQPGLTAFTTDRRWFGVFVATGQHATKEEQARFEREGEWNFPTAWELAEAKKKLTAMMERLYKDAEAKAMQGPKGIEQIQSTEREAAEFLHLNASWAKAPVAQGECPECHAGIATGLPIHYIEQGGCGAVIDLEKVKRIKPRGYEHLWKPEPATATK